MTVMKGWKLTNVDGTTHGGYRWPLPMPGETVTVAATNINHNNTGACPSREGDGLCVVREGIIRHVTSGGQRIGSAIGLDLRWDKADELGNEADEKIRVAKVEVVGLFDPVQAIEWAAAAGADLRSADLRYADLRSANLRSANLRSANLGYANLRSANLRSANLRYADLGSADLGSADLGSADLGSANLRYANLGSANLGSADLGSANLRYANLRYADLRYANLRYANLRSAAYTQQTLWPEGFDPVAAGAIEVLS